MVDQKTALLRTRLYANRAAVALDKGDALGYRSARNDWRVLLASLPSEWRSPLTTTYDRVFALARF